jgi:hypothetical protein
MNTLRKQYTEADFKVSKIAKFRREGDVIAHTHTVKFGRPLTEAERLLFQSVLASFCLLARFLPNWEGEFVTEPVVEFVDEQTALYTFSIPIHIKLRVFRNLLRPVCHSERISRLLWHRDPFRVTGEPLGFPHPLT